MSLCGSGGIASASGTGRGVGLSRASCQCRPVLMRARRQASTIVTRAVSERSDPTAASVDGGVSRLGPVSLSRRATLRSIATAAGASLVSLATPGPSWAVLFSGFQGPVRASCVLSGSAGVRGVVHLSNGKLGVGPTVLEGRITGLAPGLHGFHVHQFGDLVAPSCLATVCCKRPRVCLHLTRT